MARAALRMCAANIILSLCQYSRVEAMVIQAHFFVGATIFVFASASSAAVSTDERLFPLSSFLYFSFFLFVFVLSRAGQVEVEHWFRVITRDPLITEPGKTKQDRALYPRHNRIQINA